MLNCSRILSVVTLVYISTVSVCAYSSQEQVSKLIDAMKAGESALFGVQVEVRKQAKSGKITQKSLQCINSVNPNVYSSIFIKYLTQLLKPSEIASALDFYNSDVGKKFSEHQLAQAYQQLGVVYNRPVPKFTQQEARHINYFASTSAGKKLLNDFIAIKALHDELGDKSREIYYKCMR